MCGLFYRLLLLVFLFILFCPAMPAFCSDTNDIAYRYTDGNTSDKKPDEYFDAYGNKITETEYRYQHDQQAKKMQESASKPFGEAGTEFGSLGKKSKEKTEKKKSQAVEAKTKESDAESAPTKKVVRKPKVLVS